MSSMLGSTDLTGRATRFLGEVGTSLAGTVNRICEGSDPDPGPLLDGVVPHGFRWRP